MPPDSGLKHKPFSALRTAAPAPSVPAAKAPAPLLPDKPSLGRVVVREEFDAAEKAVITRIIGVPHDLAASFGKRWREVLGATVALEGRDMLVMASASEHVAELLRSAGASEVVVVQRPTPPDLSSAGEAGGTERAQIRRGVRVAIVQKADQESGALTEGIVREILTSSPTHPRGIKVRLESGEVGRVRRLLSR